MRARRSHVHANNRLILELVRAHVPPDRADWGGPVQPGRRSMGLAVGNRRQRGEPRAARVLRAQCVHYRQSRQQHRDPKSHGDCHYDEARQ